MACGGLLLAAIGLFGCQEPSWAFPIRECLNAQAGHESPTTIEGICAGACETALSVRAREESGGGGYRNPVITGFLREQCSEEAYAARQEAAHPPSPECEEGMTLRDDLDGDGDPDCAREEVADGVAEETTERGTAAVAPDPGSATTPSAPEPRDSLQNHDDEESDDLDDDDSDEEDPTQAPVPTPGPKTPAPPPCPQPPCEKPPI